MKSSQNKKKKIGFKKKKKKRKKKPIIVDPVEDHMIGLFIDPGKKAGWVMSRGLDITASGVCGGDIKNIFDIQKKIRAINPDFLVVEAQFIHPKRKIEGLFTLVERQNIWKILCALEGKEIKTYLVDPATWHGYWSLKSDMTIEKRSKRAKDFKKRMTQLARFVHNDDSVVENQSDALLIGYYWLEKYGRTEQNG
jgi:hypothetical protein